MGTMITDNYQDGACKTAIYPENVRVAYPALGLIGELAELTTACYSGQTTDTIAKECGDVCWYCAVLARDLETPLSDVLDDCTFLDDFMVTEYLPSSKEIGEFAEDVKKFLRDDNPIKRDAALNFIRYAMSVVNSVAYGMGMPLSKIAQMNLDKLQSRQERGVLKGDGDNR